MSGLCKCSGCGSEKPHTSEFFPVDKAKAAGLRTKCRECFNTRHRLWRSALSDERKAKNTEIRRAWRKKNKDVVVAAQKRWIAKNPEKDKLSRRKRRLRKMYGISVEILSDMLAKQSGSCAICGLPLDASTRSAIPHVDHNHLTGRVRALLCGRCNTALGLFGDDFAVIRAAADYLEEHNDGA